MIFFMALTEELPIYRATYRLLNMLIRATQDFPRYYKYSLGTRMVDVCLDMSMLLYKANSSYEKTAVFALEKKYKNNTLSIYPIYE